MAEPGRSNGAAYEQSEEAEVVPAQCKSSVDACAFAHWHRIPALASHAAAAELVPLPDAFVQWLLSDGVDAAPGSRAIPSSSGCSLAEQVDSGFFADGGGTIEEGDDGLSESETGGSDMSAFPDLEDVIDNAIHRLGGAVLPKLNWSSPKDATWVSPYGNMCCTNADEVALLLRCSDAVQHDLTDAYTHCQDSFGGVALDGAAEHQPRSRACLGPALTLKAWQSHIKQSMEFRCFVRASELVCISQRDVANFFPFLASRETQNTIRKAIRSFHENVFKQNAPVPDCCVDVYVNEVADKPQAVHLIDINPYGGATLPLLFSWEEIEQAAQAVIRAEAQPELRVVEEQSSIRPSLKLGVPVEFYDTSPGSAIQQLMRTQREQQQQQPTCA